MAKAKTKRRATPKARARAKTTSRRRAAPRAKVAAKAKPKAKARPKQKFNVSHHREEDFLGGLREYAKYRDLGMSAATGGEVYFAKTWKQQQKAFASIRSDLAHLYSLSYYPQSNPNRGWRAITVKLVGERARGLRVRTRNGYRPQAARAAAEAVTPASGLGSASASASSN